MALSGVLSGVAAALTLAQPYLGANPLLIAASVGIATSGSCFVGIYARLVKQEGFE